jgi:DNA polymerase-3 subunit delta
MKLSVSKAAGFVDRPDKTLRLFLLYGPDAGLVRERGIMLARHFVPDINDPFSVSDLGPSTLAEEPARLNDDLATTSMLGGRRLVRVLHAGDSVFPAVDQALSHPVPGDSVAIIEAGDLDKRSKLRLRVEDDPRAMAIPCYQEEGAALTGTLMAMAKAEGFTFDRDALALLSERLPPDRSGIRMEVDKLLTYALSNADKKISLTDIEAAISDGRAEDVDEAIWAAGGGDAQRLDQHLQRLAAEGTAPVVLLRSMQRHLLRLYEAIALMQAEKMGAAEAVKSLKPPVFFKREAAMLAQLKKWNARKIERALALILIAEAKTKTSHLPAELIGQKTLFQITALARAS